MTGALGEEADIGSDRDEQTAPIHVVLGEILIAGEEAGGLAGGADARHGVVDGLDHVGMDRPAEIAEIRRQIPGPDVFLADVLGSPAMNFFKGIVGRGGDAAFVEAPGRSKARPGDTLALYPHLDNVHLFDATDGRRLGDPS
jgi:hypothetical protein